MKYLKKLQIVNRHNIYNKFIRRFNKKQIELKFLINHKFNKKKNVKLPGTQVQQSSENQEINKFLQKVFDKAELNLLKEKDTEKVNYKFKIIYNFFKG